MLPKPEPACLLIADISGYTSYLAGVELDHAQDILADLIDTIVAALRPSFRLAKLEGDAAFVYVITPRVDGAMLQDTIETTYLAFRRRLRGIGQSSICQCNACHLIPSLDLKLITHHGQVATQRMAGQEELVGRDVILIHRLLKNSVEEKLGRRAYALYTEECLKAASIDPVTQGLIEHRETIDIIGDIRVWLRDLDAVWKAAEAARPRRVVREEARLIIGHDIAAPRQLVWEYLTSPERRMEWMGGVGVEAIIENAASGRRGLGTVNHCMHGSDAIVEEIVDWKPYDYMTANSTAAPGRSILMTDVLTELPGGGTRLELLLGRPAPEVEEAFEATLPDLEIMIRASYANFHRLVEEVARSRASAAVAEPDLPISANRFLTDPVLSPRPVPAA
jgi:uncharacterized protein YndB with AHSA1/START domain